MIGTILLLPSPPALLSPYSLDDPVADLRKACAEAVAELPPEDLVVVAAVPTDADGLRRGVTEPLGHRVARHVLGERDFMPQLALPGTAATLRGDGEPTLVVVADGSACRSEKAPGHLDRDSVRFDDEVEAALRSGDARALAGLDPERAEQVWCTAAPGLRLMGEVALGRRVAAEVTYADAPYGVAWWVARWDLT